LAYIDLLSKLHKSTQRDYLARVNDPDFPKAKAASLAKKWAYDYWDGDRRINYGGYKYIPNRWSIVAKELVKQYNLTSESRVLDVGCGKGFLMFDLMQEIPGIEVFGVDISEYAKDHAKEEVLDKIFVSNASNLPFEDGCFDLVISINTLHNLKCFELDQALREITRVSRGSSYICVESYETEQQKENLLYWQVTCEAFNTPEEWEWWFTNTGYLGDHSFIYFD
jgi:SAM-dependent methyltransferase